MKNKQSRTPSLHLLPKPKQEENPQVGPATPGGGSGSEMWLTLIHQGDPCFLNHLVSSSCAFSLFSDVIANQVGLGQIKSVAGFTAFDRPEIP